MSQEKISLGDTIVSDITHERANEIRSKILTKAPRTWVFVLNQKDGKCDVSVANHLGFKMSIEELVNIKAIINE